MLLVKPKKRHVSLNEWIIIYFVQRKLPILDSNMIESCLADSLSSILTGLRWHTPRHVPFDFEFRTLFVEHWEKNYYATFHKTLIEHKVNIIDGSIRKSILNVLLTKKNETKKINRARHELSLTLIKSQTLYFTCDW